MKKVKIVIGIIALILLALVAIYMIVPGSTVVTSVSAIDITESDDGDSITMKVVNSSSIGFIRKPDIERDGDKIYLTFHHAFGGLNGKIGAILDNQFTIEDTKDINEIYIVRASGVKELVYDRNA